MCERLHNNHVVKGIYIKRNLYIFCKLTKMLTRINKKSKAVSLCKTWWVARIDTLEVFIDLLPFVVQTLDAISEGSATESKAVSLCKTSLVPSRPTHTGRNGW